MRELCRGRSTWPAVAATLAATLAAAGVAYGADGKPPEPEPPDVSPPAGELETPSITIRIGDREVSCVPQPRVRDGYVLVPVSFLTDCLGGSVSSHTVLVGAGG